MRTILHGTDYYPEQWLDQPQVIEDDLALMRDAGINAVTLGVFAWSHLEPAEGHYQLDWLEDVIRRAGDRDIKTVLATPSGARPPWMARRYPEILRTLADGRRARFGGRHNHCPTSSVFREKVRAMNEQLASRFSGCSEVILWHVSNEYQGTCFCESCARAFRLWLRAEHQDDLDLLNRRWWSSFWSHRYSDWEEIEPPTPHGEYQLHAQVIDWKRFVSHQIADFARYEIAAIRRHDTGTPTTVNLMGLHASLNAAELVAVVDRVSGDIYPTWGLPPGSDDGMLHTIPESGDLFRNYAFSLAYYRGLSGGQPWLLMESTPGTTNWHQVGRLKRPGAHVLSSLAAVAGGADSVQYFQWRQGRGGWEQFHGSVIDHRGRKGRTFDEVAELSGILNQLHDLAGLSGVADAAVILDTPSRWMINQASGPRNDGRRGEIETAMRHVDSLTRQGLTVDVVPSEADVNRFSIVVLPMVAELGEETARRLLRFVEAGGTLLVTYFSGVFDRWQRLAEDGYPAWLNKAMAVSVVELDQLAVGETVPIRWVGNGSAVGNGTAEKPNPVFAREYCEIVETGGAAQTVAVYGGQFYAGSPAITRTTVGKGTIWYEACRLDDTGLDQLVETVVDTSDPGAGGWVLPEPWRGFVRSLQLPLRWMARRADSGLLVFLFNPVDAPCTVTGIPSSPMLLCRAETVGTDAVRINGWGSAVYREAPPPATRIRGQSMH
ncbi:MAG: beta-galactosidase [Spirochaetaceae bacterium]|nr:MAG: beta-galactosidase [Spirochaetaceae bacterium]